MHQSRVTFIVSSRERSSEGSSSSRLPVWDLLQVYQGVWQRLPVHMEHLTPISVLTRPAQDQCQLEEEDVEPLTGINYGFISIFTRNYTFILNGWFLEFTLTPQYEHNSLFCHVIN